MKKFFKGFVFAFEGLIYTLKTQINFKFHLAYALLVVAFGFIFEINKIEWLLVILCIGWVLFAELINTALESLTDLASNKQINELAKHSKDVASAAVLIASFFSAIIGGIIFFPKLYFWLKLALCIRTSL